MKQLLLSFITLMLFTVGLMAQTVYDNAEDITLRWAEDFGDAQAAHGRYSAQERGVSLTRTATVSGHCPAQ